MYKGEIGIIVIDCEGAIKRCLIIESVFNITFDQWVADLKEQHLCAFMGNSGIVEERPFSDQQQQQKND